MNQIKTNKEKQAILYNRIWKVIFLSIVLGAAFI